MKKDCHPKDLAAEILFRSTCAVMVGCCIADHKGRVISWGWNSVGPSGFGLHAEEHALSRANRKRLNSATLYVAAVRKKSRNVLTSKPCADCQKLVKKVRRVIYRDVDGEWKEL